MAGPSAASWRLRATRAYPWPEERPNVPVQEHGWLHRGNERLLLRLLAERRPKIIIELGSWLGLTTSVLLEAAAEWEGVVFAVDRWDEELLLTEQRAQYEQADSVALEILQQRMLLPTFLANTWEYRHRLFPVRMDSVDGLRALWRMGVLPDLIYVDADHTRLAVLAELEACEELFPKALVCGDDWQWLGVREAVRAFAEARGGRLRLHSHPRENWWWFEQLLPQRALHEREAQAAISVSEESGVASDSCLTMLPEPGPKRAKINFVASREPVMQEQAEGQQDGVPE